MAIATDGFSDIFLFIPIVTAGDWWKIACNSTYKKAVEANN
jgi:hypothetical protein